MRIILKIMKWTGIVVAVLLLAGYAYLWQLLDNASVSTHGDVDLGQGNVIVPSARSGSHLDRSTVTDSLVTLWSEKPFQDWQTKGKVQMPRILTGKLAAARDVDSVNVYLQDAHVRGTVGSTGPWHKTGDYDFTLAGLSLLLNSFGDQPDLLYPETVDHVLDVLMTEEGGDPVIYTPKILGLPLRDTENHILMTEGSRYLKNRWKALHGNPDPYYDNVANGLEDFLLEYLAGMHRAGLHEYNARPYIGYTLTALLNLESFASDTVRASARRVLDRANWEYALGSLNCRRWAPFRRQARRSVDTDLDGDYHTGMVKAWMSLAGSEGLFVRRGEHQALWAAFTTYRIPEETARWIESKPAEYFVQIGHGHDGSPEIFSGGPGYLLSAGGASRDRFGQAVARPTTLMLEDGAMDLTELLRVSGPGDTYREWNNTGVHERFAVSAGPVVVPEGWTPEAENAAWQVYRRTDKLIAVHSADSLGIICLLESGDAEDHIGALTAANADGARLDSVFIWPSGRHISYDVRAPKDQWVITAVDGQPVDRDVSTWPLMRGDVPGFSEK